LPARLNIFRASVGVSHCENRGWFSNK